MRILIVDDDFQNREILRMRLEQAGYAVDEASNGADGLKRTAEADFDLVIADVMMPVKDGWHFCKELKADPKTAKVPVIILTAKIKSMDELMSFESGADEYLTKPVDHVQLIESVKRLTGA